MLKASCPSSPSQVSRRPVSLVNHVIKGASIDWSRLGQLSNRKLESTMHARNSSKLLASAGRTNNTDIWRTLTFAGLARILMAELSIAACMCPYFLSIFFCSLIAGKWCTRLQLFKTRVHPPTTRQQHTPLSLRSTDQNALLPGRAVGVECPSFTLPWSRHCIFFDLGEWLCLQNYYCCRCCCCCCQKDNMDGIRCYIASSSSSSSSSLLT